MTETDLLDNVLELAGTFGWRSAHFRPARTAHGWRTPVGGDGKGFPDLVLVRERVVFAELKREGKNLEEDQVAWWGSLTVAGAECYLWRPSDWLAGTIDQVLAPRGVKVA